MIFFDLITLACEFRVHRAGSQLKRIFFLHFAENLDRLWRRTVDIPVGDSVFVADGDGEPPVVCPDELYRAVAGTRQLYVRSLALVRSLYYLTIGRGT